MYRLFISLAMVIALGPVLAHAGPGVFKAKATWHQLAPANHPHTSNVAFVTMWFDAFSEEIRASITANDLFFNSLIASPVLACAPAGTRGPQVAESFRSPMDSAYISDTIAQLAPKVAPETPFNFIKASNCGMGINNIASVAAAAKARRLYLVFQTEAGDIRGQLWPEELLSVDSRGRRRFLAEAKLSGQQVLPAYTQSTRHLTVNLSFSEGLGSAWYSVPNFGTLPEALSVGFHCAPAGETGPLVATLLASAGPLTDGDIMPVSDDEVCGVTINNLASVLEALLQGHLYAVLYTASNPYGEIRGQFEHVSH